MPAVSDEALPHHLKSRPHRSVAPVVGPVAGILGILIPAVGVLILPIWEFPDTAATGPEILRWATAHRGALEAVQVTNTLGVTLWMVFGVAVWARLRAADADAIATSCFLGGTVGFVTMLLTGFTMFDLLLVRLPAPALTRLLYDAAFGLLAMSGMPTAVALVGYAVAVHRGTTLPRSTAWFAALTALAHVALLLSFLVPRGFFSLEGQVITVVPGFLWVWILWTAVAMARTPGRAPAD